MSNKKSFIEQTVVIKKPQADVFKALTDANELMRWFPTRVESDPRVGGKYKFEWEFANADENGSQEGEYVELAADNMLSYTWKADDVPTLVSFNLSESNGETTVVLEHASLQDGANLDKLRNDHADQWGFFLMNLKGYLEAGMDMRREKLKMITN